MKTFQYRFRGSVDAWNGTVVLREAEYNLIQIEAFEAGRKQGMLEALVITDNASSGLAIRKRIQEALDAFL